MMEKYEFIYIIHLFLFQINRIYKIKNKKQKLKKLKYYFDIMYKYQLYQNRNGYFQYY